MTRTPLQITDFGLSDIPDQTGKTILITGANNGLGLQAATALAGAGARIILTCRNQATGQEALNRVRTVGPQAEHGLVALDLADLAGVREARSQGDDAGAHDRRADQQRRPHGDTVRTDR
jgi:NAD(P)-dependent dehydrogenase (short-subunit alcohol dehydrogenase family)